MAAEIQARKYHAILGLGTIPDWSPDGKRLVILGFNVNKPFAEGGAESKALMFDATSTQIDSLVSLSGAPSFGQFTNVTASFKQPFVVWTWKRNELFYMKNGSEGVAFRADGSQKRTLFKLPEKEFIYTGLFSSPSRKKLFFATYEDSYGPNEDEHVKRTGHLYIADLVEENLYPFKIEGFEESVELFPYMTAFRTGWFSNDVLALSLPMSQNKCAKIFGDGGALDEEALNSECWGRFAREIFVDTNGNYIGNWPREFEGGEVGFFGDGRRVARAAEPGGGEMCLQILDLMESEIEKERCFQKSDGHSAADNPNADERIGLALPGGFSSEATNQIWLRFDGGEDAKTSLRLYNLNPDSFDAAFSDLTAPPFNQQFALPSPSGSFHALQKVVASSERSWGASEIEAKLGGTLWEGFKPRFIFPEVSFEIYSADGKFIRELNIVDFDFN